MSELGSTGGGGVGWGGGGVGREIKIRQCFIIDCRILFHTRLLRFFVFWKKIFTRITGLIHTGAKKSVQIV